MGTIPILSHWSYSQFSTLIECGEKYRLTKVCKAPELPAWWNIGGSSFHEATEFYDRAHFAGSPLPGDRAVQAFHAAWAKHVEERKQVEPDADLWRKANRGKEDGAFWLDLGPALVLAYIRWREQNPQWQIIELPDGSPAIEAGFTATVGGQTVKGAIDRVFVDTTTGQLVVVDFKSGSRKPKSDGQLRLYGTVWERLFGAPIEYGSYYMARKTELLTPMPLLPFPDEWIEQAELMRRNRIFLPNVSEMCKGCGVARFCAAVGGADAHVYAGVTE